jgi:alpha-D-ribose 1-methylphosphonate 5-triphosphate synthase subunit PhnG
MSTGELAVLRAAVELADGAVGDLVSRDPEAALALADALAATVRDRALQQASVRAVFEAARNGP